MLVLSRRIDQTIVIDDHIEVTVVEVRGDKVRVGITADDSIPVNRKEIQEKIDKETHVFKREWRSIPGWPGYRVSNDGKVESCRTNGGTFSREWKPKEGSKDADGYYRVHLHYSGKRSLFVGVHHLVLTCFGSAKPPGNSICLHRNAIRDDNRIENLRWGFPQDNADDRDLAGNTARHERNGNAKLDWDQVHEIRMLRESGMSLSAIAVRFNVHKKTILEAVGLEWQ